MNLSPQAITAFQKKILSWYQANQRDLPWRKTRNAYNILISEVMSQQTQISRVVPKYLAWLERFPTIEILAKAPTSEVLRLWSGLGYNRRALNLQKCAQEIMEKYNGRFPQSIIELEKLPGIGKYTASAISCFSFNQQIAVIDTNIRKVIRVEILKNLQDDVSEKEIETIAQQLLPKGKAYEWNQALMDYAANELKHHKIPIPKQTPFKTSNRYYRGTIMKYLVHHSEASFLELASLFTKENKFIVSILTSLEQEGLVRKKGEVYQLP